MILYAKLYEMLFNVFLYIYNLTSHRHSNVFMCACALFVEVDKWLLHIRATHNMHKILKRRKGLHLHSNIKSLTLQGHNASIESKQSRPKQTKTINFINKSIFHEYMHLFGKFLRVFLNIP